MKIQRNFDVQVLLLKLQKIISENLEIVISTKIFIVKYNTWQITFVGRSEVFDEPLKTKKDFQRLDFMKRILLDYDY